MTDEKNFPLIKRIDVEKLIPYARNSRTHSPDQVAQIAASIKEFGFLNPVIIDGDMGIIAGHGRVMAARKLGITELPCIDAAHLTETQKRAYIIADNKLAMNAGWDDEMLRVELQDLVDVGFDIELTGFSLDELEDLATDEEIAEPKEQSYAEIFNVIIECQDEAEQESVYNKLQQEGYSCQVQSL